jgi:outer membrane protein OmpA-like peptidoglycan-associated protein
MSNLKMALIAIAAPIGACATRLHDAPPLIPSGYNFSYQTSHREEIGLIQAFDDGTHTYLQFQGATRDLLIRGANDQALSFRRETPYVTLEGVFERLVVLVDANSASIVNQAIDTPTRSPVADQWPIEHRSPAAAEMVADAPNPPRLAAVGIPESVQTMQSNLRVAELNREISQLQARIERLSAQLEEVHQAGNAANVYLRALGVAPRLVVQFDDNSAEARVEEDLLAPLGAAGRAANRIYLHAHTDAFVASDTGTDLAIRRAVAVRQLLLAQEVSPERVRLFYRGAGNFIANNATAQGKAMNRRVEIEFRKW